MRAFHMNVLTYNANTNYVVGQGRTPKQEALRGEMYRYRQNIGPVDVAGFTEVLVANGADPANILRALNDFGAALGIPAAGGGGRKIAVIRCGRTALLQSSEVVAIVVSAAAQVNRYGLLWFNNTDPLVWRNRAILPVAANNYTSHLSIPQGSVPDYRFIVYVDFNLGATQYVIGFIHNRAPGHDEVAVVMQGIRDLMRVRNPVALTMCGGDFNTEPLSPLNNGTGLRYPANGHYATWYYAPGATSLSRQRLDYWTSHLPLISPPGGPGAPVAHANGTLRWPEPDTTENLPTGSDHRGVGIEIA